MTVPWNQLSQRSDGRASAADFERAAYRLATEQVLYAADRGARGAYHLVEDHFDAFVAALAPLGIRLERNARYRYIVALPAHAEGIPVTLDETLLLLVLRQRYDEAIRHGAIEEQGDALVELPDLQEAYQALTGRAMPEVGALRTLARSAKRWGVARLEATEPGEAQPFRLRVQPAIVEILDAQWLQRLAQHSEAEDDAPAGMNDDDSVADADDDPEGGDDAEA
ncbi:MAG: DUF4194 domain-containing protein [Burkholderiaceae bacterium]|jgi:hypothetical protein|nr:MAG: DUF4194 domain-containing protein [Burkholderiaceae bacterium]